MSSNNPFFPPNMKCSAQTGRASPVEGTLPPVSGEIVSLENRAGLMQLGIRPIEFAELDQAVKLFSTTPGWENYAENFRGEAIQFIESPLSAVLGAFMRDGTLVATGCAIKESFDFAYWSITWLMVDQALRGQGVGAQIVRGIEEWLIA